MSNEMMEKEIADGCNKAYLKAGHNAYFGNGFEAGVRFALENEFLRGLLTKQFDIAVVESAKELITKQQRDEFAVDFANWLSKLIPSEKVSVWSKDGQYGGLFTMDNEQLLDQYKRKLVKKNNRQ